MGSSHPHIDLLIFTGAPLVAVIALVLGALLWLAP